MLHRDHPRDMKTAVIFSIPAATAAGYAWKWRASAGKHHSASTFIYYYECVENARSAGYAVDLAGRAAMTVEGRARDGVA